MFRIFSTVIYYIFIVSPWLLIMNIMTLDCIYIYWLFYFFLHTILSENSIFRDLTFKEPCIFSSNPKTKKMPSSKGWYSFTTSISKHVEINLQNNLKSSILNLKMLKSLFRISNWFRNCCYKPNWVLCFL